jgi:hypothetical protein
MSIPEIDPAKVHFAWSNYFRPTPVNLQYFATMIRGLFVLITGTTIVMEAGVTTNLLCLATGYLLDEAIKFLGRAAQDYQHDVTITETTFTQKETVVSGIDSPPSSTENG